MLVTCKWCGVRFNAPTKRAQFCSVRCRVTYNRAKHGGVRGKSTHGGSGKPRKKVEPVEPVAETVKPPASPLDPPSRANACVTEREVASQIAQLRGIAAFFSCAAERGPEPRRRVCRYLSDSVLRVLEAVGL